MIRPDQIPDEVVEPLAIAIAGGLLKWQHALDMQRKNWRKEARAAIATALSAWPRWKGCWDEDETGLHRCLLLPLPYKKDAT